MKKYLLFMLLAIAFTACSNDSEPPVATPAESDYASDFEIMNKFVDVNKSTNEYFINPNKKPSLFSYINNSDLEALNSINPVSYKRFTDDLKALNGMVADALKNPEVGYVVFSTMDGSFVKKANDAEFILEKVEGNSAPLSRSIYMDGTFMYNQKLPVNFTAGRTVQSVIQVSLTSYTYYFIQMLCKIDAKKSPNNDGRENLVVLSGTTMYESFTYSWTATQNSNSINWQFECYGVSPKIYTPIATVRFQD
jgi:hypothetical protein